MGILGNAKRHNKISQKHLCQMNLTIQLFGEFLLNEPPHLFQWWRLTLKTHRNDIMLFIISLVSHISIKNTKANSLCDLGDPAVLENQGIQRDPLPLGVPTCPSFLCDPSCREPQGYPECPDHQQVLCLLLFHYHPTRTRNTVSSDLIWEAHMWMDGLKDGPTPFLLYVLCLLVFLTCPKIKIHG